MARRNRPRKPKSRKSSTQTATSPIDPSERLRPWLLGAAMALLVARPLFPSESAANEGDGLPAVMLWIVLGLCWLLGSVTKPRFRIRFGWIDLFVVILVVWHSLAAVVATRSATARPALNMLWEWIALGLGFLLMRQWLQRGREVRAVMVVMISLAVALSGFGFYQYLVEMPDTRAKYQADPDQALRDAGLWFEPGSVEREAFEQRLASTEPTATFVLTNSLAGFLVPWLTVLFAIGFSCLGRIRSHQTGRLGAAVAISALLVVGCLLLTKSRSGYVAAALGFVLVGLSYRASWTKTPGRWKWIGTLSMTIVLLTIVAVAIGGLDREVVSEAAKSFGYRIQYWQSTVQMIADHPMWGCGPGQFQNAYLLYKLPDASEEIADPHNFLLEVWATAGTIAMLALVLVLGSFFWCTFKRKPRGNDPPGSIDPVANSTDSTNSPNAVFSIFGGGLAGLLLSIPLGMFSSVPPGLIVLVSLPMALVVIAALSPWVREGEMHDALPAMGVVVLLVNLLAAGGIGYASVAGSLWILLAAGLATVETEEKRILPSWSGLLLLTTMILMAFFCYTTGYLPVMQSRTAIQAAYHDRFNAEEHLTKACQADPWAVKPWKHLADLFFHQWTTHSDPTDLQSFEECVAMAHRLDPNSSTFWHQSGVWYDQAYRRLGNPDFIDQAVKSFHRAVELYPTRATYRAHLAFALLEQGDELGFHRQAEVALRLDEQTPHLGKKLPDELRQSLKRTTLRINLPANSHVFLEDEPNSN